MNNEKKLNVTKTYGILKFSEIAYPYNENVHDEQLETCVESINQQIADSGKEEMKNAFHTSEKIIE